MTKRFAWICTLALFFASTAEAKVCWRSAGTQDFDLGVQRSEAARRKGPVTLRLHPINPLRYELEFGTKVTLTAGPDLSLAGFIPSVGGAGEAAEDKAATEETQELRQALEERLEEVQLLSLPEQERGIERELRDATTQLLERAWPKAEELAQEAKDASDVVDGAAAGLNSVVTASDRILREQGAKVLETKISEQRRAVSTALEAEWPSSRELKSLRREVDDLVRRFEEMPLRFEDFSPWAQRGNNRDDYREGLALAQELSEFLSAIEEGSDAHKAFQTTQGKLVTWSSILEGLSEASFTREQDLGRAECGYPFFEEKRIELKMVKIDRTITDSDEARTEETLAVIECPSHFGISAGMGITGVDETDFELVAAPNPDAKSDDDPLVVNKIAFANRSSEQVNPITVLHTRLTNGTSCDWHVSAGTVFDLDHPDSGVKLGYLLGLSFSLKDRLYLTGGLQVQRTSKLIDGVEVGSIAPEGLTKPPVEGDWAEDWVFTVSFKLP